MSEPAAAPDALGEQLTALDNGDWVRIDLDNGSTLEAAMIVGTPEREDATESYSGRGGIWFTAETTNADRDRLGLPSVVLYIRATERDRNGWERPTVEVHAGSEDSEYEPVGEIERIEARSKPT